MIVEPAERLRVALLAGSLAQGGAEKQLVYMARALRDSDVDVRIYCLTRDEFYEDVLRQHGFDPIYAGRFANPLLRIASLAKAIRPFRPHILQSANFFANLYVAIVGRALGCLPIGSIRNDTTHELQANGVWGPWLLRLPPALIANSYGGRQNAIANGVDPTALHTVCNVLDLDQFDAASRCDEEPRRRMDDENARDKPVVAVALCRLVEQKRLDRFISALALARRENDRLIGLIVGAGPLRQALEEQARRLELSPEHLSFSGRSDQVPQLLSGTDILVSSSDYEGFSNVLLEAMAARRPIITTPAGDAARIVEDSVTGYVVPFQDVDTLATRMVTLAESPELRRQLGQAGRRRVEDRYSFARLSDRLLTVYQSIAQQRQAVRILAALPH